MAGSIYSLISDPEALLALEPEELGGVVLEHLNSLSEDEQRQINRYNFGLPGRYEKYPPEYRDKIIEAVMEGWAWLEREGLIVAKPGSDRDWVNISRRGLSLSNAAAVDAYRRSNLLPKGLLHPTISHKVWAAFLRGDYDTAVFQAFKEVEVSVRTTARLTPEDLGVPLMRKAFHPDNGPLTNYLLPKAEREALMHLFSGAIGSYKNAHSHRHVTIEPSEAVEMIMLASHLLQIVDSRKAALAEGTP
jgi:uncharacterized protein (TIGR02391 family)